MARKRKALPTVKLERHPHRDATERLRQAYQLLNETHQNVQVKCRSQRMMKEKCLRRSCHKTNRRVLCSRIDN
jgi:hypothetical protein